MKKILLSIASIASLIAFNACNQRDVVTPAVVEQSETPSGTRSFDFAMYVVGTATQGSKATGISQVKVTAIQGGSIQTKEADENGLVIFSGLSEGNVAWHIPSIAGTNYVVLSGTTLMSASSSYFNNPNQSNQKGTVSQIVKLPTLNADLAGRLVGDFDFDNKTPFEAATGVIVRLQYIPSNQNTTIGTAGTSYHPEPNFYLATTDANGAFSFVNVPALDNNADISAIITIEYFKTYGGQTFRFTTTAVSNVTAWLKAERSYDAGTIELTAENTTTASVTGIVFGDFNFINKTSFDANYAVTYPTGSVQINNGTTLGFSFQQENMDYVVIGGNTILGLVYNNLDNQATSLTGSNVFPGATEISLNSFANISTLPGYSPADYQRQNTTIAGLTHYLRYNFGGGTPFAELVPASAVTYASLSSGFTSSNVIVRLNFTGTTSGPTEFVTRTDANGRFAINSIPSGSYTVTFTYEGDFTLKDGYTKKVVLNTGTQRANTSNTTISSPTLDPNKISDFGAIELK